MAKKKNPPSALSSIIELEKVKNETRDMILSQDIKEKLSKLVKTPGVQEAFKSQDSYKKLLEDIQKRHTEGLAKSLSNLENQLKPEYGLAAQAVEQLSKAQSALDSIGLDKYQDKFKKLQEITEKGNPLDFASQATNIVSSLNKSALLGDFIKKEKENRKKISEMLSPKMDLSQPTVKFVEKQTKYVDTLKVFEEERKALAKKNKEKEDREKEILEHNRSQTTQLEAIASYMVRQEEVLKLQKDIMEQELKSLEIQNKNAENQIAELERQNKIMQDQQEENRKTSKVALWTAIASILLSVIIGGFGIYFSYKIYIWQDISDNKNQKELIQTIESLKSYNKEITELMKKQIAETKELNKLLKKSVSAPKKRKIQQSKSGQKPSF